MLIGEYQHTLDGKRRTALPVRFRKEIGKRVVITHGLDNCLFVYSSSGWKKISEKLGGLSIGQADTRGFNRFILAGAVESDVDAMGRILIPEFLTTFAGLKTRIIIVGIHDHVEIWDEKRWKLYKSKIEKQADAMAEKLGEIGAI